MNIAQQPIRTESRTHREFDLLIDRLLADEQEVSLVARFARVHETSADAAATSYAKLIPLSRPEPGEQYAFEVDLDLCSGCKACVTACHSLNGLEDSESWRDVGLLAGPGPAGGTEFVQQTVTAACHHCIDPACLNGCPVLAYDKDPVTGIVRHLDDQCIGCQYCVMKCPYDVPKYSEGLGIVRKCDMCHSRLAHGEAPACAQACPNEAITVTVVSRSEVERNYRNEGGEGDGGWDSRFLPSAASPGYTLPTTRYRTVRANAHDLRAGDAAFLSPASAHYPLTFLLLLTQLSVGLVVAQFVGSILGGGASYDCILVAFASLLIGLGLGLVHLGRPSKAWKSFLGWRRSWFSREVIVFGGYAGLLSLVIGLKLLGDGAGLLEWLPGAAAAVGLVGVFTSVMVYADCRREFWSFGRAGVRFFGTTMLLGVVGLETIGGSAPEPAVGFWVVVLMTSLLKGGVELIDMRQGRGSEELLRSARLMRGRLLSLTVGRFALLGVGGVFLPLLVLGGVMPGATTSWVFGVLLASEWMERVLFFRAVSPTTMPGGFRT